jgi:hypothetical protein
MLHTFIVVENVRAKEVVCRMDESLASSWRGGGRESKVAFSKLYDRQHAITAADMFNPNFPLAAISNGNH